MGQMERRKGKVAELAIVHAFQEYGFTARRSGDAGQVEGDVVVEASPLHHVQVKRVEALRIPEWLRELEDAAGDRVPLLTFRRSNEPWYACTRLDDYLDLLRSAQASRAGSEPAST